MASKETREFLFWLPKITETLDDPGIPWTKKRAFVEAIWGILGPNPELPYMTSEQATRLGRKFFDEFCTSNPRELNEIFLALLHPATRRVLRSFHLDNLALLVQMDGKELLSHKNISSKRATEIDDGLRHMGLRLCMSERDTRNAGLIP